MDSGLDWNALREAAESGSQAAVDALFNALYAELRRLASRELARQGAPISLSATTLVHKVYLEIVGRDGTSFPDQGRFMGYAARVMRGLIIDHARSRRAQKNGGQFEIMAPGADIETPVDEQALMLVSEALDDLAKVEPKLAQIVDLKFFCGFSFSEVAAMNGVCERTIQRQWEKARIYLHRRIREDLGL